jgi:hypothetical protein
MKAFRTTLVTLSLLRLGLAIPPAGAAQAPYTLQPTSQPSYGIFPVDQIQNSLNDIVGEAALKQPGGPTYDFLCRAMPPLRYVDANFLQYPITLSAPGSLVKARFVSNGSAVNALARQYNWIGETGIPFGIFVGDARHPFGANLAWLKGPSYADGYLPIVQLAYDCDGISYSEEAFASTDEGVKGNAVVFLRIQAGEKDQGAAPARLELKYENAEYKVFKLVDGQLLTPEGKLAALVDPQFKHYPGHGSLVAELKPGGSAYIAILTEPADPKSIKLKADAQTYASQRARCAKTWNDLLARGTKVSVPEPVVNNAWRAALIGDYMLLHGDDIRYSQGNQYAKLYIAEGGDATQSIALWGHLDTVRKIIPPLFHYTRKNLEYHQAARKLQMLANFYELTRDADYVKEIQPLWEKELSVILKGRQKDTGMLPPEKYAGDLPNMVHSANSNSNSWRALRDMSVLLDQVGDKDRSQELAQIAADYRKIVLAAIDKAMRRDVDPPFLPVALDGGEQPYKPIWGSVMGSYWNIMIEYVLGSGVFTPESQTATDIIHYIQKNGGLCMGLMRARATPGWWVSGGRINDLYGMRYALMMLRRDDPDRANLSLYGKLAQGYTRDTFIGCEGSSIGSPDGWGRQMYLPPNSASNANYLEQLRYTLVQDYDLNDDGHPETLRLAFATPRPWLKTGGRISVIDAPTAFGPVSFTIESQVGSVKADVTLPDRNPAEKVLLRLRLPDGEKITSAKAGDTDLKIVDHETLDLSQLKGKVHIVATVAK